MLKSLTLTADGMPISGYSYEDIPKITGYGEGFHASGRKMFRESWPHAAIIETAISSEAEEHLKADSEAYELYQNDLKAYQKKIGANYRNPRAIAQKPDPEKYLKRYGPEELSQMGYDIPENIQFEDDGKLNLLRFSIYSQANEDNTKDAETAGAMAPGFLSWGISMAGGLSYSLSDPLNAVPVGGGIITASKAYKAGKAANIGKMAIMGQAVKAGAIEGMAGAAVADALAFPMANKWGADLGWEDALSDIAISGVLGSFFGALGGGLEMHSYNRLGKSHLEAASKALNDLENGRTVDVSEQINPVLAEARERLDRKLEDIEYVHGLLDRENEIFDKNMEDISARLTQIDDDVDNYFFAFGEAPAVFRMIDDGPSSLEINTSLLRRLKNEDEWANFDIAEINWQISRPAAVFDMGYQRKTVLINLKDKNGVEHLAAVETHLGGINRVSKDGGKLVPFTEIDDINLLKPEELSFVGLERRLVKEGKVVYADPARLKDIKGLKSLGDEGLYSKPGVLRPDKVTRRLAMEDLGFDLDKPMFEESAAPGRMEEAEASMAEADGRSLPAELRLTGEAAELEIALAEQSLEDMAAKGELSDNAAEYLRKGSGEGDEAVMSRETEAEMVEKAEATKTATECALESWGIAGGHN